MNGLPVITLPKYELTLPSTQKKIKFRPFVVREEKILLIAMEEEDTTKLVTAIKNTLSECAFGLDIDSLPQVDAEYLFLNIRNKSMGEGIDAMSTCIHCNHKNYMSLDLSKTQVIFPEVKLSDTIELAHNLWVKMRLPNLDDAYTMSEMTSAAEITKVVARCIVNIIHGEVVVDPSTHKENDLIEWIENLPEVSFIKITEFLSNVPIMKFEQEYNCTKCGQKNLILLEGLESFFD